MQPLGTESDTLHREAGDSDANERQPLLGPPTRLGSARDSGAGANLYVVLPSIMTCCFLAGFDVTVVAAIYPAMFVLLMTEVDPSGSNLNSSNRVSWIAVAYTLSNTAFQPLYGRLSDIFGRRPCLLSALTIFLLGTVGCALAPGLWTLVASRTVAGIGGGGLNVLGVVILSDLVPLRRRGAYQGYLNVVYSIATSLGGPLGGVIADMWGWRWSFGIQIPLMIISIVIVAFVLDVPRQQGLPESITQRLRRVDFMGACSLIVCVTTFMLGLNFGGNELPWTHPLVITALAISAASLIIFIFIEKDYAKEPILPLYLLTSRTPLVANLSNWLSSMAAFSVIYSLPLFYQVVLNLSSASAGLRLIPASIGISLGSLMYGVIMSKTGKYYWLGMVAYAFQLVGTGLLATLNTKTPTWQQFIYVVPSAFGFGGTLTLLLIALISSVPVTDQATATGMSYLFRSTGTIVGVTSTQCVLQNLLKTWLTQRIHGPNADYIISKVRESASSIYNPDIVPIEIRGVIIETYVQALQVVFLIVVGFVALNTLAGAFLQEYTLHDNLERRTEGSECVDETA